MIAQLGYISLVFGPSLHLLPYYVNMMREDSDKTAWMCRHISVLAACQCDRYQNLIYRIPDVT